MLQIHIHRRILPVTTKNIHGKDFATLTYPGSWSQNSEGNAGSEHFRYLFSESKFPTLSQIWFKVLFQFNFCWWDEKLLC